MEPVTHLAAGLLTAQALEPDPKLRRPLSLLCGVAATIPDVDILSRLFSLESYLLHHRGITHSVFFLPVFALLLAWAARKMGARLTLARAWTAAALALATHIFLDVVTAFGTQVLLPFSNARLSFEGVFVVDPAFTVALYACLLLGRQLPAPAGASRRAYALAGLALLVCYPLACNALRLNVQHRYEALLTRRLASFDEVTAIPDALSPWYWKIVVRRGGELTVTTAELPDVARPHPSVTLRQVPRQELAELGRSASIFGTYAWFAEHPASYLGPPVIPQASLQDGALPVPAGGRAVRYVDALFLNTGPVLSALSGHRPVFSELTVVEDAAGHLLAWFDERGRTHPVAAP